MSVKKVLFIALLSLLMTLVWTLPSQTLRVEDKNAAKRELFKNLVEQVKALIAKFIEQLKELMA